MNLSIRKLIKKAPLPRSIKLGDKSIKVDWEHIIDMADAKLIGHPLFRLLPALQEWPKPYVIARKSGHVKQGIDELLQPSHAARKAAVLLPDEKDYFDCPFGLVPEHLQKIELLIDFGRNQREILSDIKEIYNRFKTKQRGRQKAPPSINLKQLGALRLKLRGYGTGKSVGSFPRLRTKLEELEEKLGHKEHLLPLYASETGLIAAADKARKRLRYFRKHQVSNMFGSSDKDIDF